MVETPLMSVMLGEPSLNLTIRSRKMRSAQIMFSQCRSTDVQKGGLVGRDACSPEKAKQNPGRRVQGIGFPRIPLRCRRATIPPLFLRQQARIAAGRRGVDRDNLLQ